MQFLDLQVRRVMAGQSSDVPAVPMTVRQLEAIVRIAEALTRMRLNNTANPAQVRQAVDLFKVSTMDAVRSGLTATVRARPIWPEPWLRSPPHACHLLYPSPH